MKDVMMESIWQISCCFGCSAVYVYKTSVYYLIDFLYIDRRKNK